MFTFLGAKFKASCKIMNQFDGLQKKTCFAKIIKEPLRRRMHVIPKFNAILNDCR